MLDMFFAIFFKEYIKTRLGMLLLICAGACAVCWIGLGVNRLFLLDHPEIVWYRTMDLHQIPYVAYRFVPLLSAIAFCFFQFLPEMRDERMRLSLHLPCPLFFLMLAHFCYGLAYLALLFCAELGALLLILSLLYPTEAVSTAFWTMLPWCLAGIYAYLCFAWLLLEPKKKTKLLALLLFAAVSLPLLMDWTPGGYTKAILPFLVGIFLLVSGLFLSAIHFRTREVE
ncbi:MAG: hypothetical protein IJU76_11120 [Desulfovibrionaceae bacterium]|nr:hypothetical protein [Desulfovibrionaceae bacterium]